MFTITGKIVGEVTSKPVPTETQIKKLWDNHRVIGEMPKSDRTKVVVSAVVRDGIKYINIREFYIRRSDQQWMPGRDGIIIPLIVPIEQGTKRILPYQELTGLFELAARELETMPLSDPAHMVFREVKKKK
jgi:hypothetical protein